MSSFEIALTVYAFAGCTYWLWMALGAARVVLAVPILSKLHPPDPATWPRLSIVIPACNEADAVESAVRTILDQDYPDLEIIVVDDRSTDRTGEIVDRIAAEDGRLRPLHVTELPDGWLGKVHALNLGKQHATGDWLLFTDADVHYCADMLRRAIAHAEHRRLDHLAATPDLWPTRFLVDVAVAMFVRCFCVFMRCWAIEDPHAKAFIGIGAFNLVRRSALERTAGFEWLRLEVADDVALGMMLKQSGARCALVNGSGLIGLSWYPTLADMARGTEKGFASVARCRLWRLLAVCLCTTALELAPFATFIPVGHGGFLPAGLAMLAAAVLSIVLLARWGRARILPGLCFPIGVLLNVAMLLRCGWLGVRRGGIVWRGTLYPSAVLRDGARVRLL